MRRAPGQLDRSIAMMLGHGAAALMAFVLLLVAMYS
jgi:hypothetical protein